MVGEHGCDMRNTHGRRGVSTAGSGAHFHGIAAKLNGFVVNRGFDGHAVLQGWGDEDEVSPLACIPATDGGPVEGPNSGGCGDRLSRGRLASPRRRTRHLLSGHQASGVPSGSG